MAVHAQPSQATDFLLSPGASLWVQVLLPSGRPRGCHCTNHMAAMVKAGGSQAGPPLLKYSISAFLESRQAARNLSIQCFLCTASFQVSGGPICLALPHWEKKHLALFEKPSTALLRRQRWKLIKLLSGTQMQT